MTANHGLRRRIGNTGDGESVYQVPRQSALVVATLLVGWLLCASCRLAGRNPALEWDQSPQARIVRVSDPTRFPGVQPTYQDWRMDNHIPEGTLYGDGRIVWVEYAPGEDGISRHVMEGRLTEDQMTAVLERFVTAGFFTWKDQYGGSLHRDGPPASILAVRLSTAQRSVVVSGKPPRGFADLVALVSSGAGARGHEYVPERAYLNAYPVSASHEGHLLSWPAEEFSFGLRQVSDSVGRYVEGPPLEFAWRQVNAQPANPLAEDQGEVYLITLLVPGLSNVEPPHQ